MARRGPNRRAYASLWSFPGGHVEDGETLDQALLRETPEGVGVTPIACTDVGRISDPNAPESDPVTYYMFAVTAWQGGEPAIVDDEHTDLEWVPPETAVVRSDPALEEYRPLFGKLASERRRSTQQARSIAFRFRRPCPVQHAQNSDRLAASFVDDQPWPPGEYQFTGSGGATGPAPARQRL